MLYQAEEATPPRNSPKACPRILVVEDDADLRYLNMEALRLFGFAADGAENGAIAWRLLQTQEYDLLLTDHDMPRMTGLELLRNVRNAGMRLPIIMATGNFPHEAFAQEPALCQGVTMLPKPYSLIDLVDQVGNALDVTPVASRQARASKAVA